MLRASDAPAVASRDLLTYVWRKLAINAVINPLSAVLGVENGALLPLQHTIVDQTLRQYNAMQTGVRELLFARTQQLETNRAYVAALRSYWLLRADLDQLLAGRLMDDGRPAGDASVSANPMTPAGAMGGGH